MSTEGFRLHETTLQIIVLYCNHFSTIFTLFSACNLIDAPAIFYLLVFPINFGCYIASIQPVERSSKNVLLVCAALKVFFLCVMTLARYVLFKLCTNARIFKIETSNEKRAKGKERLADRISQHVQSAIRRPKANKKPPDASTQASAIGKHLCESPDCVVAYSTDWFSILDRARTSFHLATLEAAYIASLKPVLCRQKSFVYTLRVFGGL